MAIKNVVLVGAAGTVGSHIYKALVASPANFNITLLSRPDSKSSLPEGAKVIRYEYSDPALVDALRGQDAVVVAISGLGALTQIPLADAAAKAGVKKFIPSEFGGDTQNSTANTLHPWYAEKKAVYDHLVKLEASTPGFTATAVITGPFFTAGIPNGFLLIDTKAHSATIPDGGNKKVSYTEIPQVALAISRILERDVSGVVYVSSVTASQNDIVDAFERLSGHRYERKQGSTEEYEEKGKELLKSDEFSIKIQGFVLLLHRIIYGEGLKNNWGVGDNAKLGLEEEKLDDLVKIALAK